MRTSGSPRFATVQSQAIHTPVDLNWNARAYGGPAGIPVVGNVVPIIGYGMWSVYILTTAAGNTTLELVVRDDTNTATLATLPISAGVTSGATRHYTFGPAGATLAVVAWWVAISLTSFQAGNATVTLYGRASN